MAYRRYKRGDNGPFDKLESFVRNRPKLY